MKTLHPLDLLNLAYEQALHQAFNELGEEIVSHGDHSNCDPDDCSYVNIRNVLNIPVYACPKCGWQMHSGPTPRMLEEGDWRIICDKCRHRFESAPLGF